MRLLQINPSKSPDQGLRIASAGSDAVLHLMGPVSGKSLLVSKKKAVHPLALVA
jgi:hypothetical protein